MSESFSTIDPQAAPAVPMTVRGNMQRNVFPIRSRTDIDALLHRARRFQALGGPTLTIDLPGLSDTDRQSFESRLNKAWNACGCAEGGITAMLAIPAAGFITLHNATDYGVTVFLWAGLYMFIALALGGLLGKLAGLALANLRFRSVLKKLALQTC